MGLAYPCPDPVIRGSHERDLHRKGESLQILCVGLPRKTFNDLLRGLVLR